MIHASRDTTASPRRRATRQRIVDAATQLVVDGGFDALSIHAVAAATDFTPGALYRYFRGKDAIVAAITEQVIHDVGAWLDAAVTPVPASESLRRAVVLARAYRAFAEHAPHRFGLVSMLLAEPRVLVPDADDAAAPLAAMQGALGPLVDALADAAARGRLDPGDALDRALGVFGLTHGLLQLRKQVGRAPGVVDLDRALAGALRALLIGWGARPTDVDRALETSRADVAGGVG